MSNIEEDLFGSFSESEAGLSFAGCESSKAVSNCVKFDLSKFKLMDTCFEVEKLFDKAVENLMKVSV